MKKIIHAPYIDQTLNYPTGCESVSAVMLLNYLGIPISVDTFIEDYLECRPFEMRGGERFGADPFKQFAGSPYDADAFGCYAPVIARALTKAAGGLYAFPDETGTPVKTLLERYIDRRMPVIFWCCLDMKPPVKGPSWRLADTGETFTWTSNEHCMLLVGYDEKNYYFNDPWQHHGLTGYPKAVAEKRHQDQKSMAVGCVKQ